MLLSLGSVIFIFPCTRLRSLHNKIVAVPVRETKFLKIFFQYVNTDFTKFLEVNV